MLQTPSARTIGCALSQGSCPGFSCKCLRTLRYRCKRLHCILPRQAVQKYSGTPVQVPINPIMVFHVMQEAVFSGYTLVLMRMVSRLQNMRPPLRRGPQAARPSRACLDWSTAWFWALVCARLCGRKADMVISVLLRMGLISIWSRGGAQSVSRTRVAGIGHGCLRMRCSCKLQPRARRWVPLAGHPNKIPL